MFIPSSSWRAFLLALLFILDLGFASAQDADNKDFTNIQNAQVTDVLNTYEQLSGKRLIRDAMLAGGSIPPMTINASGVSKAELMKLIEANLLLNGVAILPIDDHTLKVITTTTNKVARSEGVKLYANAADLPSTEQIVSYYMPLSYISPVEAQNIFSQNNPIHNYGAYVPAPSAQAIIVTENVSVIRELIALKELIDVPPAKVTSEFVQLERADAEKVADILTKLLDQKAGAPGAPAQVGGNVIVPPNLGTDQPLSNEKNLLSGGAQIVPVPRSNQILVVTRPVNMPFLRQLIAQLDQPDIFLVPQRRPLRYVSAQDILPALEEALAQGKDEEDQVKKDQSPAPSSSGNNSPAAAQASTGGTSSNGSGSTSAITPQLQAPTENNVPTVVSIGKTKLLADNRSNSIIVFGSPDVTARVFGMIDELDRKPLQVYLATVIGQLTVKEGEEFGIDLLQKFQNIGQGGIASSSRTTSTGLAANNANVPEPGNLITSTGFPLLSGLTIYGAIGSTLNAYVRAVETTNHFKVISRPSVYTTNNTLAVIASGSQVPVPANITSGYTGTTSDTLTTTSSVQYENVLLQLDIIPLINANHEVTLKIRQTNNTLGSNNIISGNDVPTINTQEINTEVTIPDKSTVVIGGLISDTVSRDTTGVPFLSDIPLLGYFFKDVTKSKDREELIIMIQPTVVETAEDQIAVDEAEKQRTLLGQDAEHAATGATPALTPSGLPRMGATDAQIHASYNPKVVPPSVSTPTIISVPAATTSPDVSNGKMPKYPVPSSSTTP